MDGKDMSRCNRNKRRQIIADKRQRSFRRLDMSVEAGSSSASHANSTQNVVGSNHANPPVPSFHSQHPIEQHPRVNLQTFPDYSCQYCGAIFWYAERVKAIRSSPPVFSLCCRHGCVKLPHLKKPPILLRQLFDYGAGKAARSFRDNIRIYNSMFAFTSIGGKIDHSVNKGQGPYIFRINGQNHHMIGSLLPVEGEKPHFAQLYIYDTENEAANRVSSVGNVPIRANIDESLVQQLIAMFDRENELVKVFRMARDRFLAGDTHSLSLKLCGKRRGDGLQYNAPTAAEIAGLLVGDFGETDQPRDIIVEYQTRLLRRINDLHPSFMAMQYPILFPYGEDGYTLNIHYQSCVGQRQLKRGSVTRREYYAYILQQRGDDQSLLLRGGKLFQQYVVDAFTCIEDERLRYIRFKHQQEHFRCELYKGVQDAFLRGDVAANQVGQRVILPSSFTGGPRYMIQNYHDAMAICRSLGNPDLFITFTCNVKWIEIQNALDLIPGQRVEDRPDIVARVFHMKLEEFMADIKQGKYFGTVIGSVYTVEFQKRGLPHVHIIIWLKEDDKHPIATDIDKIISAEIPSREAEPRLYDIVSKFMIHGPCGDANPAAPCMINKRCIKHFPKKYYPETLIGDDGFAIYRRRSNDRTVVKAGVELDNRFVVPYNKHLLLKYEAHVNVEWCNQSRSIKYLFKYVNKGSDRTRAVLQENSQQSALEVHDEVKNYIDCRYVSSYESCWRIFEYHIHHKYPAVERLGIHMPLENNIVFPGDKDVSAVLQTPGIEKTMLTEWMYTNSTSEDACELTYVDFPSYWRWDGAYKIWFRRRRGQCIGRITYVHPSSGDCYYLRMLLSHVRGAKNFADVRTVNGFIYDTFKEACNAMGLIGDDREWHQAMEEAAQWATSHELRNLFVALLIFCEIVDANKLFEAHLLNLQDDIVFKVRRRLGILDLKLSDDEIRNQVLLELQTMLEKNGTSLSNYKLPRPSGTQFQNFENTMIREELNFNAEDLMANSQDLYVQLNKEQKNVYDTVLSSVYENMGGFYFVYGHGGTGKTFLYQAMIAKLRSEGRVVLAVASSGIASLLLPGGRTGHSRFKIPIEIHGESSCHIKKGTQLAELIKMASLIIWDEAPMAHRHYFEALDRTLRDILSDDAEESLGTSSIFGGKTIVLGGDFRQILPVVIKGTRHETVQSCITQSYLWRNCKIFKLEKNMRLTKSGLGVQEIAELEIIAEWLLHIGEGKVETLKKDEEEEDSTWIKLPDYMTIKSEDGDVSHIISEIYDGLLESYQDQNYLKGRAIVTGTNESVDLINSRVLSMLPLEEKIYLSFDSIFKASNSSDEDDLLYPPEFLNSLSFGGIPNHKLYLKIQTPVMLLRNLNQTSGLCNGTRLMISRLGERVIEAIVITGSNIGDKVFIPRIIMSATERKCPFTIRRRQFPLRLCYAMTINKSQGQTLDKVGLYLPRPVFSHGQFYVAVSRVTSHKGLKIQLRDANETDRNHTKNIVYQEIFEAL